MTENPIRAIRAAHEARLAANKAAREGDGREGPQYQALKKHFPHIRHDPAFLKALLPLLTDIENENPMWKCRTTWEAGYTKDEANANAAAAQLAERLHAYTTLHKETVPADYNAALALLSSHLKMAKKANADYKGLAVNVLKRPSEWQKDPDCWTKCVTALREKEASSLTPG
ncbi:MAG: hypothetical protein V4735_02850 [Pseudomonadota bacterium]